MTVRNLNYSTCKVAKAGNDGNAKNTYRSKTVDWDLVWLWSKAATRYKIKAGCTRKVAMEVGVAIQELDAKSLRLAACPSDGGALSAVGIFGTAAFAGGASKPSIERSRYPGPTGNKKPADALTKLGLVGNTLYFDAELGKMLATFKAEAKDGGFREESFIITMTDTDGSGNKSKAPDSTNGAIGSRLKIGGEKGSFLKDTFLLRHLIRTETDFSPPTADGTL